MKFKSAIQTNIHSKPIVFISVPLTAGPTKENYKVYNNSFMSKLNN